MLSDLLISTTSFKNENLLEVLAVYRRLGWLKIDLNLHHFLGDTNQGKQAIASLRDYGFKVGFASGGWCDFFDRGSKWRQTEQSVERQLSVLEKIRTKRIRLFLGRLHKESYNLDELDNVANNIASIAARHPEVKFSFENHDGVSLDPEIMFAIISRVDLQNVGVTIDPINYLKAGSDPYEAVRLHKKFIFHVHAKGLTADGHYCEYGAGQFDYVKFLRVLNEHDYLGDITLEYEGEFNPFTKLVASYSKLEADLKAMGRG